MRAKMLSAALFAALVLSAAQSVRADEATYNYWEGSSGDSWTDKNSGTEKYKWTTGDLPTATETAAFKQGTQTVKIKDGKCLAAKVVFESGSVITFSRLDSGWVDAVTAGEFSGEGTLKLLRTGLKAAYAGCTVSVAGFEVLHDNSYPSNYSWLDGGTAESEKMVVESAVTGSGNLACNNYVEVNGDVTLTGFLKLSANATVKNLVYDNGGCKIASESTGGTIEKVTVKSGTLEYSSSTLKSVSAITVGKFVLDGGTLSVSSDFSGTIAVAEGGGTLFLEGEWNDDASVSLPAGLSFAEGADLSKVTVQATIGGSTSPATFAIAHENETYSLEYVGYSFHLEDIIDISTMSCGWPDHPAQKNKSVSGGDLYLYNGYDWVKFERGLSAQATSSLRMTLNGNGVSFSALVGVDKEVTNGYNWNHVEDVKFIVRDVSDENNIRVLAETGVMTRDTPYVTISADLTGVYVVEFLIDPNDDGGDWDQANWVNPNIVMKPADPITVNDNVVADYSTTKYFSTATVAKGVFAMRAGASFSGEVAIGTNGAIAVDMTGKVSAENLNGTIDLFSTPTLTLGSGDSVEKAVYLYGPVVGYTIGTRVENNETVVYATITDVADISSSRKVTVFTAGYADAEHWNDVSGNWSAGAPSKGSFDIGVFCEDASINYMTGFVFSHGDFVVRGATVTVRGSNSPNLDMLRFAGSGTVLLQNASVDLRSGCALAVDAGVTINVANGTVAVGTGDSVSFAGALVIGANAKLKVYVPSNATVEPGSDFVIAAGGATFADGVTSVSASIVGHDEASVEVVENGGTLVLRVTVIVGETAYWVGGSKASWNDANSWDPAEVPHATQTAIFTNSATALVGSGFSVSNILVGAECTVILRCDENGGEWSVKPQINFYEIKGEGKIGLYHVRLVSATASGEAKVTVPELEIVDAHKYDGSGNDQGQVDSGIGIQQGNPVHVYSDITGSGVLFCEGNCLFSGGNSNYTGNVTLQMLGTDCGERRFVTPQSGFSSAALTTIKGRFHIDFTEGVLAFGDIDWQENYGKGVYMPYGTTDVTIEVGGGTIHDTYQNLGIGVYTRAEGSLSVSGATPGCEHLTVKKTGSDKMLSCGLTKAFTLDVAEGHVSFTGENVDNDNQSVEVVVREGASIGSAADVTIGSVAFANGAKVLQTYDSTTPAMPVLTLTGNYNISGVRFGVTNPADLPAVTSQAISDRLSYPIFAATGTISGKPTAAEKYGEPGRRWLVTLADGRVRLRAATGDAFVVIVR